MEALKRAYKKEFGYEMMDEVSEEFHDVSQSSTIPFPIIILDNNPKLPICCSV
jgi:hypothetical protein